MYACILVPIDGSPTARHGLDEAIRLAVELRSRLCLVHVVEARLLMAEVTALLPPDRLLDDWRAAGQRMLAEAIDGASRHGLVAEGKVRCEPGLRVWETILDEAAQSGAELVVMGTHGRHGLQRLAIGSEAEMVLRESPVPVLLVRGPHGGVTP
ncbi:MAG: universal stress protein [Caldimonas sp.]